MLLFLGSIINLFHITQLYNNSVSHLNGSSDLCYLSLINLGRSVALCRRLIPLCFAARLADASGSAVMPFSSICFMQFRMCCNLTTAPNIRDVSFGVRPTIWMECPGVPDGQYAIVGPPDPWALCILSPTSDTPGCTDWSVCWLGSSDGVCLSLCQALEWIEEAGEVYLASHTSPGDSVEKTQELLKEYEEFGISAKVQRHNTSPHLFLLHLLLVSNAWHILPHELFILHSVWGTF